MQPLKIAPSVPPACKPLWHRPNGCGVNYRGSPGPVEAYVPPWPWKLRLEFWRNASVCQGSEPTPVPPLDLL